MADERLRLLDEPRLRTDERDGADFELDELRLRTDERDFDGADRDSEELRLLRTAGRLLRDEELLGVTAPLRLLLRGLRRFTVASLRAAARELLRTFRERNVR